MYRHLLTSFLVDRTISSGSNYIHAVNTYIAKLITIQFQIQFQLTYLAYGVYGASGLVGAPGSVSVAFCGCSHVMLSIVLIS